MCIWEGKADLRVPSTVRRAEAESSSISDLTVHVYVPSSPSFMLEMLRKSLSFLSLRHKHRWAELFSILHTAASRGALLCLSQDDRTHFKDDSDAL